MLLARLSDKELVSRLDSVRRKERTQAISVIVHLAELERRELHLVLGYSSLFDFCRRRLGYSEAQSSRRVRTARCIARFPRVLEMLRRGALQIASVSELYAVLSEENEDALLEAVRGKSFRETEAIVAAWRPGGKPVRDRIRPVAVSRPPGALGLNPAGRPSPDATRIAANKAPGAGVNKSFHRVDGQEVAISCGDPAADAGNPQKRRTAIVGDTPPTDTEIYHKFEFGASARFKAKFDEVTRLMASRDPRRMDLAGIFEATLDLYIDKHSPARKAERRAKRERAERRADESRPATVPY